MKSINARVLQDIIQPFRGMNMKKKHALSLAIGLCSLLILLQSANGAQSAPDTIVFGQPLCLTGFQSPAAKAIEVSLGDLWVEEVNRKGGYSSPNITSASLLKSSAMTMRAIRGKA